MQTNPNSLSSGIKWVKELFLAHFNKYSGILHAVVGIRIMLVVAITAAIIMYILELIFPVSLYCLTA